MQEEEEVPVTSLHYYDNKLAVDHLMSKPHGLFYLIDDATRGRQSQEFITGNTITNSFRFFVGMPYFVFIFYLKRKV